jgi:hypothetical protein
MCILFEWFLLLGHTRRAMMLSLSCMCSCSKAVLPTDATDALPTEGNPVHGSADATDALYTHESLQFVF